MRVNIYAEEMTDRVEIVEKTIDGQTFTGLRFYLELPVTVGHPSSGDQVRGPFLHRPGDDDSSAVTFWGKRDLRVTLRKALDMLDEHYGKNTDQVRAKLKDARNRLDTIRETNPEISLNHDIAQIDAALGSPIAPAPGGDEK